MTTIWALSDLHYGKIEREAAHHLEALHRGAPALRAEHAPAAVIIAGDIVDRADPAAYVAAGADLARLFPGLPLLPAVGNHELTGAPDADSAVVLFCRAWGLGCARYRQDIEGVPVLALDMALDSAGVPVVPTATMAWLEAELAMLGEQFAILVEHCPLAGTVGDRDPDGVADYSSTNPAHAAFRLSNSGELRALLARRPGPRLFLSGHTHSGWRAPGLVKTERPGGRPVTFANLMAAHFTGINALHNRPDVVMLWQVDVAPDRATLTARELLSGAVAGAWDLPLR